MVVWGPRSRSIPGFQVTKEVAKPITEVYERIVEASSCELCVGEDMLELAGDDDSCFMFI